MKNGISVPALFFLSLLFTLPTFAKAAKKDSAKNDLDIAAVRKVVREHLQEVQKCYTDLIIEGMAAKGKVTATWDIDDKGAVQNLKVKENTSDSQALEGCVTERVISWTFPAAKEGETFPVTYPFQFGN